MNRAGARRVTSRTGRTGAPGDPSRILMTADPIGGIWTYAVELARTLASHGVATSLAVMGGRPSDSQRRQAKRIRGLDLFSDDGRLEWMDDPWEDVARAGRWLLGLERELEPDVVHLNGYAHGALAWTAPCVVVGHSCVLSWWRAVEGRPPPRRYRRYRAAVRRGLLHADAVVTPTAAFGRELVRYYGPLDDPITIPNGRRATGLPCGRKQEMILAAGRLGDEAKNFSLVERVAPHLSMPVYAAGDRGGGETHDSVTCLGRLPAEELAEWYSRAAILVHPARYEPFGLAPLEAALAGCALVLGDIPSLRETWRNAALYVDPDDDARLREMIERLARHPERRRRIAARARRLALSYGPERMTSAYLRLYRDLGAGVRTRPVGRAVS